MIPLPASCHSPWSLRWRESPPALTWSWSDRTWSRLLRWTRLSARPALWPLGRKCFVETRWCRRSPPVYWPLQIEWREKPLLQTDRYRQTEIMVVTNCIILIHKENKAWLTGLHFPRDSPYITALLLASCLSKIELFAEDQDCEIVYYHCWLQYNHAQDRR